MEWILSVVIIVLVLVIVYLNCGFNEGMMDTPYYADYGYYHNFWHDRGVSGVITEELLNQNKKLNLY